MSDLNKILVGDLVQDLGRNVRIYGINTRDQVGIVIDILEPQIYDRGERILVHWTGGYRSYEKEFNLKKIKNEN
jgi:hypothetical protein